MGQFDQAIACWHRLETLVKGDREASEMIMQLAQERLTHPDARGPPKGDDQTEEVETDEAEDAEPENLEGIGADVDFASLTPRQRLESAIREDPSDVSNYLALADLLCETEQYSAAERILERALGNCAQEQLVHDRLERVTRLRIEADEALAQEMRRAELQRKRREEEKKRPPWLEFGLCVAAVALFFQIFPESWRGLATVFGGDNRLLLLLANFGVLVFLIWLRQRKRVA
jgi:hypothetical protein